MNIQEDRLKKILEIGIALSAEKDPDKLLNTIVSTAMDLTHCDGGTLYILQEEELRFRIMKTKSKGIDVGANGEEITIPPVSLKKENICAYAALTQKSLNIPDVYESDLFDFSGPKKYDELNGYRTQSMVAIPMINKASEVIGVMQLINAIDEQGSIRPFTKDEERILLSLASQTAISLANMKYLEEIQLQIWSFTEALTEAIDARTPYNGSHTRKVAEYAGKIADYINELYEKGEEEEYYDKEHRDQLVMAALLHDIGKMIVPIGVMNKQTRLEHHLDQIDERMEKIGLLLQIDLLKGDISPLEYEQEIEKTKQTKELAHEVNQCGFISDELYQKIQKAFEYEYAGKDDFVRIPFLTQKEKECMVIRKGTLTDEERKIMESHVIMTKRILDKVYFNRAYKDVPVWASQHHECLNGDGYPDGIVGDELCKESRILAVADICDALLATDRPYKKPLPKEKAFDIMYQMAKEGRIEEKYVRYLEQKLS